MPEYAFYNSQNLINIKLPERLKFIGTGAFYGCKKLCVLSIPKSVQEVNKAAFGRCVSLERIEFKGLVKNISESIFEFKDYDCLPSMYHSHCKTMGCCTELIDFNYEPDIESFKCITIVVPKSTKNKYIFKPIHHYGLNQREMDRRFNIIESDESC